MISNAQRFYLSNSKVFLVTPFKRILSLSRPKRANSNHEQQLRGALASLSLFVIACSKRNLSVPMLNGLTRSASEYVLLCHFGSRRVCTRLDLQGKQTGCLGLAAETPTRETLGVV